MSGSAFIEFDKVRKIYGTGQAEVEALAGIDLQVREGEFVAVMGPSGSGKSTAMNILGCLDTPTSGAYRFRGVDVGALDRRQRALLRRNYLGFVFQGYNLLKRTSGARKRRIAADLSRHAARRTPRAGARGAAPRRACRAASITRRPNSRAASSSVSRSRAPSSPNPPCCSPTSRPAISTPRAAAKSWNCSSRLNRERGITIVMVTHEPDMAAYALARRSSFATAASKATQTEAH